MTTPSGHDHPAQAAKWIDRCYNHPDLSPWHVREALRELLAEVESLRARVAALEVSPGNPPPPPARQQVHCRDLGHAGPYANGRCCACDARHEMREERIAAHMRILRGEP